MKTLKFSLFAALLAGATLIPSVQAQSKPSMSKPSMAKPSMAKPIGLTGIVAGSFTGREFIMRANGQTYRVRPLDSVSLKNVRGGDQVRVWGRPTGLRINYANVRVLRSGASSNPEDFNPAPNVTIESKPTTMR